MIVSCTLTGVLILALWIPATSNAGSLVFAPVFGFTSGAAIGLTPALVAQISPIREIGTRNGLAFGLGSFAALIGSPIGGALITQMHGGFSHMQLFAGIVCLGGSAFFLADRVLIAGVKLKQKV